MRSGSTLCFRRITSCLLLLLAVTIQLFAPAAWAGISNKTVADRTVMGKVTSKEDGAGISGVNVVLKGAQNGSTTAPAGHYAIGISGDNSEPGLCSFCD